MNRTRALWIVVTVMALLYGLSGYTGQLHDARSRIERAPKGRDFASYFMASRTADAGRNPYLRADLLEVSRRNGRAGVHPFFYPPPFLLVMTWTPDVDLTTAYRRWALFDLFCALTSLLVLALWWRPLHPIVPATVVLLLGATTAIPNNHVMGQANHLVLLLVLTGLWADHHKRPGLAGFLVGCGCMAKMSPALFVLWWIGRRRWRAVGASVATAVGLSIAALWVLPLTEQIYFYREVLPQFASGKYNGLAVSIDLFGNHSLPNALDYFYPGGGARLTPEATWIGRLVAVGLVGTLASAFRWRSEDPLTLAGQVSAVAVLMLLLPVYTYEHHLVWALPAVVAILAGIVRRRLSLVWIVVLLGATWALTTDLRELKRAARVGGYEGLFWQEVKFLALLTLFALSARLGSTAQSSQPDQVAV